MHPALTRFPAIDVPSNGLRFRVHTAGEGDRVALLLHGFPESWFSWRDQMPLLARLGYRVWAPDLRGYGGTEKPKDVRAYRMETLLDDVAGLVDAAKPRELLLVAHDWGGMVGWEFVRRRVRPVDRFVALNIPHPVLMRRALRSNPRQLARSWYMFMFQLPFVPEWYLARGDYRAIKGAFMSMAIDRKRFPKEVLDVYRDNAAQPGALRGMLNWYRAALRHPSPAKGAARVIETPTLMLWGEEDKALGKELTFGTEDLVRDLTVRYIPEVSHWVQQEAPETVNAMLEAWLTGKQVPQAWEVARASGGEAFASR
ncbi:alpha/beta fold hydrolase [Sandaracinus amylolyticus]|uniref:Putative epoxide hydrolase-related protein n=1 Tax=Sandaracinus amylolyticus TaxID=927083 RepID=A0A0F6YJK5_9BACT|nr:alpha/beta fold hydrolase [Sandaracinus amylolyticus]AKF07420.1 Putative epoxide hydrolase-related protein [Sandaracinus amylolyticus]